MDSVTTQLDNDDFIEIPVLPMRPVASNPWQRAIRIATGIAFAAVILPVLWLSVGALWRQATLPTDGTLMPALTGISVNSALLFIFVTDFIAARTGYAE